MIGLSAERSPCVAPLSARSERDDVDSSLPWGLCGVTKALFHYKIHDLEILDERYEPKYAVELAGAGDASQASVFTGTRGHVLRSEDRPADRGSW